MLYNENPKDKFREDLQSFDLTAALRQFISDNITLCLIILSVSAIAALSSGAKGVLTHRRVGTVLLIIMICRAYHAGSTSRKRIVIKDVKDVSNDPDENS